MPNTLWKIFHERPKAKKKLIRAPYDCLRKLMSEYYGTNVMPASMNTLHTYGRDIKVNNHLHTISTEGGFNKEGDWLRYTYLPFERKGKIKKTINEVWRDFVLDILKSVLPRTKKNGKFIDGFRRRYPNGFYVYSPSKCRIKTGMMAKNKAKYITRYARHPPISDRRLESYDGKYVTFWYDHPTTNVREWVTMDVFEFIRLVLTHIPNKGFKMVLYYGLYSPRYRKSKSYQSIFNESGDPINPKDMSWRQRRIMDTGSDPLACDKCGEEMILVSVIFRKEGDYHIHYRYSVDERSEMGYPEEEMWIVERNRKKSQIEMVAEHYLSSQRNLDFYVS